MAASGSVRGDGEDARRRQLIEATIESLADVGFAACTLMDIARRAGVSPGLVAHYFGDKDGLLEATLRHMAGRISRVVSRRLAEASSPRDRIQVVIDANLAPEEFDRRTASVWLAFWGQVIHSARFRRVQNVYQSRMLSNLRHALRELVPGDEAATLAVTIAAVIDGLWLRETLVAEGVQEGAGARAIVTALVDAELAALRTRRPSQENPDGACGHDRTIGPYIGGRVRTGGGRAHVMAVSPVTGGTLARVEIATPADLDAATDAARRAQASWAAAGGEERGRILRSVADSLRRQSAATARVEAEETGRPIRHVQADILDAAIVFERFAALAAAPRAGKVFDQGAGRSLTLRQVPAGIVFAQGMPVRPLHAAALQLAPALAAGNAVILASSERAPVSLAALALLLAEAGLPAGIVNVLHGPPSIGQDLCERPDVAIVGPEAPAAAHAALIVLEDADLDAAVGATLELALGSGAFVFAGGCHVWVQNAAKAEFVRRLALASARVAIGNPLDPRTQHGVPRGLGPEETSRIVAGEGLEVSSERLDLLEVHPGALTLSGFVDAAGCVRLAEGAAAAFLFTQDAGRGARLAERLRVEACWLNFRGDLPASFGQASDEALLARYTRSTRLYVDNAAGTSS